MNPRILHIPTIALIVFTASVFSSGTLLANSLSFDGTDHVVLPSNIAPTRITIEAWFKLADRTDPSWIPIIDKETGSGAAADFAWRLGIETERPDRAPIGALVFQVSNGQYTAWVHSTTIPELDTWYHTAATYDGFTLHLYVNGILEDEGSDIYSPPPGAVWEGGDLNQVDMPTGIAHWVNGSIQYFHGKLDEVRIWDYARSGSQILAAKDYSSVGNESGLVAYWDFELGVDTSVLLDKTINAYNGTIVTASWDSENAPRGPLYDVRGRVITNLGAPLRLARVRLTPEGGLPVAVRTNSLGRYSFTGLLPNTRYFIRPTKLWWVFTPRRRSVRIEGASLVKQNFTATPQ